MGQKVHPKGFRLGYTASHSAIWYAGKDDFVKNLKIDFSIRNYINKNYSNSYIADIVIERCGKIVNVIINSARPGSLIGKKGEGMKAIKEYIRSLTNETSHVSVVAIKHPDLNAKLVASNIARQLEKRVMFRRVMKKAIQSAMKLNAVGIKIKVSGRLSGVEIARSETQKEGRIPLHTLRQYIDYAQEESFTTYGVIGVKVWICLNSNNKF